MNQKEDFFTDYKKINRLLGKSNSPCNSLTNSTLEISIDWYIKMDEDMVNLISKIKKIMQQTYNIINFDNIIDSQSEDSIDDLIQLNYKYLIDYLNKIKSKLTGNLDPVYIKLIRAIDEGHDDNWNALLDSLDRTNDMLSKHNDIWQNRIDTAKVRKIVLKNSNETPQAKNLKEENEILKEQVKLLKKEKEELLVVNVSLAERIRFLNQKIK